jgi:hypothetical protein
MHHGSWLVFPFILGAFAPVGAQPRTGPAEVRAGISLGWANTSVGGETSTDLGPLLSGQVGDVLSTRTDLTLDLTLQPFKAQNPARGEAFQAIYGLAGLQVGLGHSRRVYLRPELGAVFRWWSGSDVYVSTELSPAAGFGIGKEFPFRRGLGLSAEGFVLRSGATELSTTLFGVGVSIVPIGARPRAPSPSP